MRSSSCLMTAFLIAAPLAGQGAATLPRLVKAELGPAPWSVQSGGIAAIDVKIDEKGAVTAADIVQDVAPYGAMLDEAVPSWAFEPAREGARAVPSRVLVLGFFRPPLTHFAAPDKPLYKGTVAPPELPWPTSVVVPPYPPGALGNGKVILQADISESGLVTAASVLSPPTAFDSASADALKQWHFRPATRGNHKAPSRAFCVFSFLGTTP